MLEKMLLHIFPNTMFDYRMKSFERGFDMGWDWSECAFDTGVKPKTGSSATPEPETQDGGTWERGSGDE